MRVIEEPHVGCLGLQGLSKNEDFQGTVVVTYRTAEGFVSICGFDTLTGLKVDGLPMVY
jgi:hypothetical protein